MRVLVLGSGCMGPAAVYSLLIADEVSQVTVCDINQEHLTACERKLASITSIAKLATAPLNLYDYPAATELCAQFDVIVGAVPWQQNRAAIRVALDVRRPLVGIARPVYDEFPALRQEVEAAGGLIVVASGLEPGLTEIIAHDLAQRVDRVDELHVRCGGIPATPTPPLGYKIVFGGRELPIEDRPVYMIDQGALCRVPRFSGVESLEFPNIGECEAWFDGLLPWLIELPELKNIQRCTQKTVRWPGYAAKVNLLREMGLLGLEPITVDGIQVVPKHVVDTLLYPHVKFEEGDQDVTLFRVEVVGQRAGQRERHIVEMVDRYDTQLGFTSMARTTGFTVASVARMIGRGELQAVGAYTSERLITGALLDRLKDDLAENQIRFTYRVE
jgi:lysine 6-dehydrogenase